MCRRYEDSCVLAKNKSCTHKIHVNHSIFFLRTLPCILIHMYTMGQNCDVLQAIFYLLTIKEGHKISKPYNRPHVNYMNLILQLTLQCLTSRNSCHMEPCSCYEVLLCDIPLLCNIYIYIQCERERARAREKKKR